MMKLTNGWRILGQSMNLKSLEHLLAVAETRSFSKAALSCFITQSALSRSIQNLEEELGGRLLDRIGKRNELTPLGVEVCARAQGIVREARELKRSAEWLQEGGGTIRVGLGSGPGSLLAMPLMELAARLHPKVRVSLTEGQTELQLIRLRERKLDAMVVDARRIVPAPDLRIESLGEHAAGFIVRAGHPLAARRRLAFQELLDYPVATTPLSDEVGRALMAQYGAQAHPDLLTSIRSDDIIAMLQVVERSDAIYLGIRAAAREALRAGRLRELALHPKLEVGARFAYVTMNGRTEAPVMRLVRELVAQCL